MKQSLQLRTSQHLALTPQLQQSIRLLQLSTLELHQELEQILSDNPLLERLDDPLDHSVRLLADGAIRSADGSATPETSNAEAPTSEGGEDNFDGNEVPAASAGRRNRLEFRRRRPHCERRRTMKTRARSWRRIGSPCASTCLSRCVSPCVSGVTAPCWKS